MKSELVVTAIIFLLLFIKIGKGIKNETLLPLIQVLLLANFLLGFFLVNCWPSTLRSVGFCSSFLFSFCSRFGFRLFGGFSFGICGRFGFCLFGDFGLDICGCFGFCRRVDSSIDAHLRLVLALAWCVSRRAGSHIGPLAQH